MAETRLLSQPVDLLRFAPQPIPPELAAELLPSDVPLALLPVRLETRFFAQPDGTQQLRIRVFPDQVHVDSHEPALSADEIDAGRSFWELTWRAANDDTRRHLAWQQLANRFDAQRAAWIARALRPLNPAARPAAPLAEDAPLDPAPRFNDTPVQAAGGAWQRAPLARLMPQRWIAVARRGGLVVGRALGALIDSAPAVGPDPKAGETPADANTAIDAGMRWMTDFDEAERVGMALRMILPAATAQAGIDVLLVFGVASALDAGESAAALAALVDAHHYTDGCAFVRPGTPTNNIDDEPSGFDSDDPLRRRSFDAEWQHFGAPLATQSNGATLAAALGFVGEAAALTLGSLPGATAADPLDATQMAAALWAPTWGYYLANLVGFDNTALTLGDIDWAREHWLSHVRSGGPLPSLRTGRQPYGVLPITILADLAAPAGEESALARELWLKQLLLQLRDRLWQPRIPDVPHVGRSTDPDADLAAVLRGDGRAGSYRVRHLLGPQYVQHLHTFLGDDLAAKGWNAAHDTLTRALLQNLGFTWRPRLAGAAYDERERTLHAPLVQAAGTTSGMVALSPNYIAALLDAPPLPLSEGDALPAPPQPGVLLHLLLCHALQLEYTWAAARLVGAQANAPSAASLMHDAELVNLGASTATTWRMLIGRPSPATGGRTPAQFLTNLAAFDGAALAPLGRFRAALAHLAMLDVATLERLLVSTLDAASHRLDAWTTSLAMQRLGALRRQRPTGVRIGAYGWVEHLKPAPARAPLPAPVGESGAVFAQSGDTGFMHAPSIAHAQTAALLRNAHLSHARGDAPSLFAVDLSSRRVRLATELLDGVRQGQPLGALLGYRFERSLHEHRLDDTIDDFRALAPLVASTAPTSAQAAESVAAHNVVDGLKLFALYDARPNPPLPLFKRCAAVLDELGEAIDALADALVAETAHQAVRGNTARTASTLQAIATGERPPPELDVARTPRTGIAATHRVLVLFADETAPARGWPAASRSARAQAEPRLDAWVARLLGPATAVRLTVERLVSDAVTATHLLHLSDLALRPYDVLALAAPKSGGATPQLDAMVLDAVRAKFGGEAVGETLRIDPRSGTDWKLAERSLDDLRELATRARQLIGNARAIDGRDVQSLQAAADAGIDVVEFEMRATKAGNALGAASKALAAELAKAAPNASALRTSLARLAAFGIGGAASLSDAAGLSAHASVASREAQQRVTAFQALKAADGADAAQRGQVAADRLRAVFGAGFLALPRFGAGNGAELNAAFAASAALQGDDGLAVLPWLARAQRVRDSVARLGASLHAAEALGAGERVNLAVAQLPHTEGARWVGLPETATQPLAAGRLSLVVQTMAAVDATKPMAGLLIDEWVEVVPSRSETTGIAFQHDAPDSRAPQAILLAVPPVVGVPWTAWNLHRLLLETLNAAKLRAVDAEALDNAALNPVAGAQAVGEVAHFLPALYFAQNVDGDAISPDFARL